jgi:hypothetical protein
MIEVLAYLAERPLLMLLVHMTIAGTAVGLFWWVNKDS